LPQKAAARLLNITPQAVSKRKQNLIAKIKKLA
jgi:DNA-binding transcriptional LysR family regulator